MRLSKATLILALLGALWSCGQAPRTLSLDLAPELATFLAADAQGEKKLAELGRSLPSGWRLKTPGKAGRDQASGWRLSIAWEGGTEGGMALRQRHLAPALSWQDPRYDLSAPEAEALGLVELSTLGETQRAVPVGGLFPGDPGYPYTQRLVARIVAPPDSGAEAPGNLEAWLGRQGKDLGALFEDLGGSDAPAASQAWRLGVVGDMELGPDEAGLVAQGREGLVALFGNTLGFMEASDLLVGNLEGPVTTATEANPRKRFQFRFPPGTPGALKAGGFDLVLLGNNHVFDFGEGGFRDTLEALKAEGLPQVGAGADKEEALAVRELPAPKKNSGTLAFIGFGSFPAERYGFTTAEAAAGPGKPGINADEAGTLAAIRRAAGEGKTVVVLAHGGLEYRYEPSEEIKARYRGFIDAGATLVLGSHPHLLQGVEARGQGLIAYSLGNFLFTGEKEPEEALASAALSILMYKGRPRGIAVHPLDVLITGTRDAGASREKTLAGFAAHTASLP